MTEIYLCASCSCQEILRRNGPGRWDHPRQVPSALRMARYAAAAAKLVSPNGALPSIARVIMECWDFLEVCCGKKAPLSVAIMSRTPMSVGPLIDLALHPMWDIRTLRVIEWIIFLIEHKRVWYTHSGIPCTSHSVAKKPGLRLKDCPMGIDPHEEETKRHAAKIEKIKRDFANGRQDEKEKVRKAGRKKK